ncbi:choice-of-anchor L domain-containing protein [Sorangium sp. So ce131]|uniref:choice-of-anchor L domain-containing protein n=1 Tax=Sorangium sp. So ce131 TaxID=3133282 RepID=UPI003F63C35C
MDRRRSLSGLGAAALAALAGLAALPVAIGCSAVGGSPAQEQEGAGGPRAEPPAAGGEEDGAGGLGAPDDPALGGTAEPPPDPNADKDGDGFTPARGDCNDADANVNPGAIEVEVTEPDASGEVPAPADEDCDGAIDNVAPPCDEGLALADFDPMSGARAIDLCAAASRDDARWGVLSARYVRGDGSPARPSAAVGLQEGFGPNVHVQRGARLLALSTGRARLPGQPSACSSDSCSSYGPGAAPPGFPQDNPDCPPSDFIHDDIGLEVVLRAPKNATGYEFLFKFYTFEYPEWVCEDFNDQFVALATPAPPGSYNGNLSFDDAGRPVSVNIAFFDVCDGCPRGSGELAGTGFSPLTDGATRWLKTQAPVRGGEEITLRFILFDTGDDRFDSTALIDGFRWIASGGTVSLDTAPVVDAR